ncbi:serine protease [uncultured Aquimarina sp.]|uniref:S1 family peptidase n=1 Tax=uncultured Aquimarina sp. TaxID=575652 RepID=UPI00262F7A9F|nr:serine protease [uncultured Aquimarina sp.]
MITSNVYTRVFHLKYGEGTGTCFAIDFDKKQYLITAKHVIEGLHDGDRVEFYHENKWITLPVKVVGHHKTADVSVISINQKLAEFPLEPSIVGLTYGQDLYFLGFPYRLVNEVNNKINRNFPLPLVKKGILSAMLNDEQGNYFLIDGINNPGFSGGPVVYKLPNQNDFRIAGIISGYKSANEPIYQGEIELPLNVRANTGIVIAYNIENALELIRVNPIGVDI